ncbi:glycoside hydrolase family 2 TIM barrel-domain containing protein [Brachybacterium sp. AOP29-B2-41]|uniref:glycoside hydrolase family 2 TIM barrel-domain containing protein n=1 Tax=Brachybacterium sp. AOP29-B2-41 TaxID=3457704 RepID=UPI00403360CF
MRSDGTGLSHPGRLPMSSLRRPLDVVLDGEWEFALVPSIDALAHAEWGTIQVPGLWTMTSPQDPARYTNVPMPFDEVPPHIPEDNPIGVHRRTVELGEHDGRVLLHIGAAEGHLRAVVNGELVGTSGDSHLAAEFDITDQVRPGTNEVELHVAKWSAAAYLEDQDQWWHSGISRSVGLMLVPAVHLTDLRVVADLDPTTGTGRLDLVAWADALAGETDPGHEIVVSLLGRQHVAEITGRMPAPTMPPPSRDRSSRPAPRFPEDAMDMLSINAAGGAVPPELRALPDAAAIVGHRPSSPAGTARIVLEDLDVAPWTAETPALHDLDVELRDASGSVVDRTRLRIGFRRVEIVGTDLLVNGQRILIQGVARHDTDPVHGRVMSRERLSAELSLLKRHNVNAIRAAHYPNDPVLLDLCDEYGLYVVDEADVEGHAFASTLADDPRYLTEIVDRIARMVRRDRNHACVIMWSLGNETGHGAAHDAAAAWVRRADPTRPVHYEGAIAADWHDGHAASDVVCPMYPSFAALEAYARDPRADRPVILCEYAYSQGNSTGGLVEYWRLFETLPSLQGGFIWQFADHALDPEGDGRLRYGGDLGDQTHPVATMLNGIVFPDLTPQPALLEARGIFSPLRIVSDAALAAAGRVSIRNRQAFADLSALRVEAQVDGVDGPVVAVEVDLPTVPAGATITLALPPEIVRAVHAPDALALTLRGATMADAPWASAGTALVIEQICLPPTMSVMPRPRHAPTLDERGDIVHPLLESPPRLSLWRALTDNDMAFALDQRFVRSGFFRLDVEDVRIQHEGGIALIETDYRTAFGDLVVHRRRAGEVAAGDYLLDEEVILPEGTRDGLRVGMELVLPTGFEDTSWVGLGPWENYPDRRSAALLGRWEQSVDSWAVPYLRPQSNGTRGEVTRLEITGPTGTVLARAPRGLHATLSRHSSEELESVDHWWELPESTVTHVHLDIAHRGVGTGLLGPDTRPPHRLVGSHHAWSWRLTLDPTTGQTS